MLATKAPLRGRATVAVTTLAFAAILAVSAAPTGASAGDPGDHLYDRFQFGLSGAVLWFGQNVRIDREDSEGTSLNAEDNLGLAHNKYQPRLSFRWRPKHRHELEASYQFARRSADKTLDRTIEVADTSFNAGLTIHSTFNTDNVALNYRFAIMAHERTQLGAALGLGAFFFKLGLDGLVSLSSGGHGGSADYSVSESVAAPTLSLGLYGRFRLGDHWYLAPDLRYLQFTIDRYTPRILEGGLIGQYYLSKKVGLEAGYGVRGVKLDIGPKPAGAVIDLGYIGSIRYNENQVRLGAVLSL
jgi:hypothetical protein